MRTQQYALERGGPLRLSIGWRGSWKNLTIWLDGRVIGVVPTQRDLRTGQSFPLGDGSMLHVQLVRNFMSPELHLIRDGRPLPRSASDPAERLHIAYATVFLIAGLNLALGLAVQPWRGDVASRPDTGWGCIVVGSIFLLLGFFVRRRSTLALSGAIILTLLEGLLCAILVGRRSARLPTAGFLIGFFLVASMYRGFAAIVDLNRSDAP